MSRLQKTRWMLFMGIFLLTGFSFKDMFRFPPQFGSMTMTPILEEQEKSKPRLVIAGAVKNAKVHLPRLAKTLSKLETHFELAGMVFFENDSTDETVEELLGWNKNTLFPHKIIHLISETNLTLRIGASNNETNIDKPNFRTLVLAYARNRLWHEIQRLQSKIDYVLMMDMDDVNIDMRHLEECLNLPDGWTACCANQYDAYYDLWALRTYDDWVSSDVHNNKTIRGEAKIKLFRHVSASKDPIPVRSCFGGAVLYRYQPMQHLNLSKMYSGVDASGNFACEHVSFHFSLKKHYPEFQMYIQPKFLNNGPRNFRPRVRYHLLRNEIEASKNDPRLQKWYNISR